MVTPRAPRIFVIHALPDSQQPCQQAFAHGWPEAQVFNLLDDSLARDLAAEGQLSPAFYQRFHDLTHYAAAAAPLAQQTDGILFSCSAFGPAIEQARADLAIPVLKPNEAAFEAALDAGSRIGLLVTFATALPPLRQELQQMADARGQRIDIHSAVADGALQALQAGDGDAHDRIACQAAATLPDVDALVLCQFSLARAAPRIPTLPGRLVLTTPDSAIAKLRHAVGMRPDH